MPAKFKVGSAKSKSGKMAKRKRAASEPEPVLHDSDTSFQERELDLKNDRFFNRANETTQMLMEKGRTYEASKIKKYIDILSHLQCCYDEKVRANEQLWPQLNSAEADLKLALELSATSEESLQYIKESLEDAWKAYDASITRSQHMQNKLQELQYKCEQFESKAAVFLKNL